MKSILAIIGTVIAFLVGIFFKDRLKIMKIFRKQEEEVENSEDKLETARNDLRRAKIAAEDMNKEVADLSDEEIEEYWKKKLQ